MKKFLLLIILLFSLPVFGQSFTQSWTAFRCKKWAVTCEEDSSRVHGKKAIGRIFFTHKKLTIRYTVFNAQQIDTTFKWAVEKELSNQSCKTWSKGLISFSSFYFNGNYYLLEPCYNCSEKANKMCESLAKAILNWTNTTKP